MEDQKTRKLRGGYYTPPSIANFLTDWAIETSNSHVLEPSCGDGVFLEAAFHTLLRLQSKQKRNHHVTGIEYHEIEAQKAKNRIRSLGIAGAGKSIHVGDFFHHAKNYLNEGVFFDAVVGNPPFIRYQDFPREQQADAFSLMKRAGLSPNRLTNAWIPFLVVSTLLLKNHGRLAMVIPAELFQVNYASETRLFLSQTYSRITIFTFKKLVFEDVQQEVVLILGERNGNEKHGIQVVELSDTDALSNIEIKHMSHDELKYMDHTKEKWTQYFLDNQEIELLRSLKQNPSLPISGEAIDVDVGIVTGQNRFFVLTKDQVKKYSLSQHVKPIIGRSNYLKGAVLRNADIRALTDTCQPVFLLMAPNIPFRKLPKEISDYVTFGEQQGFNAGYKCRLREHWWFVPSFWIPDAFMLRQVHGYPKLVMNETKATSTDTVHRVKFLNGTTGRDVISSFMNSLTLAFSEVTGRSYGGGVLTFEPSESERLPLPFRHCGKLDLNDIDGILREKGIGAVLKITDDVLLKKGLGLGRSEIRMLRDIWIKLRDRRINRAHGNSVEN